MRYDKTGTRYRYQFDNLPELSDWIRRAPVTWRQKSSTDHKPSMSWDLGAGYDNALTMARDGWLEGAERAQRNLALFPPTQITPNVVTDFYGYRPHVARYCAGAPDSMLRNDYTGDTGAGAVLTLLIATTFNATTHAECVANFGVAVAQYVSQIEAQGRRVEIYTGDVSRGTYTYDCTYTVKIKSADQPLDLAVAAFAIGHPAMLRRLGFAFLERSAAPEQYFDSYGAARDISVKDMIDPPARCIVINGVKDANRIARTPESALKYLESLIETNTEG